jgi:hypothetical protein
MSPLILDSRTKYPYYHPTDDRWKNSVRHNLSISPYFYKGQKSKTGAGHVWTLSEDCKDIRPSSRRKTGESGPHQPELIDVSKLTTDTDLAVASILGQYNEQLPAQEQQQTYHEVVIPNEVAIGSGEDTQRHQLQSKYTFTLHYPMLYSSLKVLTPAYLTCSDPGVRDQSANGQGGRGGGH